MQDKKVLIYGQMIFDEISQVCPHGKYGSYPFAGYKSILNVIYNRVICSSTREFVLDIGFGTAVLTSDYMKTAVRFTDKFQTRIIRNCKKMPKVGLYEGDFLMAW